jgi:hypothetical protein
MSEYLQIFYPRAVSTGADGKTASRPAIPRTAIPLPLSRSEERKGAAR